MKATGLLWVLLLSTPPGLPAQQVPAGATNRPATTLVGTVQSVGESSLVLTTSDGKRVAMQLTGEVRIETSRRKAPADIKVGDFVGSGAVLGADGQRRALEVHFIPANLQAAGEGHRQMGGDATRTMTNARVTRVQTADDGTLTMTLTYPAGQQDILIAPGTPVTALSAADPARLQPGVAVTVLGDQHDDGSFTARAIRFSE